MQYNLALLGFGGVNRALVELIQDKRELIKKDHDLELNIVAVSDIFYGSVIDPEGIDLGKLADLSAEKGCLAALPGGMDEPKNTSAIQNSGADIVVEATFTNPETGQPAYDHFVAALTEGKHVVTTNKGPIALHFDSLKELGQKQGAQFEFEGTVMSGTPVLRLAESCLQGCQISGFQGILNGTANYILGRVEEGASMPEAIKEAQELGYAEADPTADVEGYDVMLKVTILTNQILGGSISPQDVSVKGISGLDELSIREAYQNESRWKLIGRATKKTDGSIEASVEPMKLSSSDPLAGIGGPINAITFETDLLGAVTVSGPGAGKIETAYALLADILAIHQRQRGA